MKQRPKSNLTRCNECTLFNESYIPPQLPIRPQYPVLWIGQAGGQTEDLTGVPFTGRAGKMLWRLMKEAGLNKTYQNLTNIVKCVPPDDREPTDLEMNCCYNQLKEEIHRVEPQLIIALGGVASKALTGKKNIRSLRGQTFPLLDHFQWECPVLCVLHPSFVMRQRQWIDLTIEDMKLIPKFFIEGMNIEVEDQPEFILDPDEHQLAEELEKASLHQASFDTETTGLNTRKDVIVGASLCYQPNRAIAFDLPERDSKWEVLKKYLEDPRAEKITQNGQFDSAICETHGEVIECLAFDTLLAEHILSSDLPGNLDFLRSKYTHIKPYKPTKREMKVIQHWPKEKRLEYGCLDALTTYQVAMKQMELMTQDDWRVLQEIDLPLVPVVNRMERRGMLVDTTTLALLYRQLLPQLEEMEEKYFKPLGLNPNSPTQLAPYFGIEDTEAVTLKKHINKGHDQRELMQITLDYRGLQKATSVYLLGIYDRLEEGRIHTQFNITGTGTGRLSSTDPNLQNVFKEGRVIYIADDDDHVLVEGDYSQLELRVVAVLADETTLLNELAQGINVHYLLAYEMFHKKWNELTDIQKLREKAVVFGTIGGRSARSIAIEFGIPTSLAEEWQALCFNKYPKFHLYKEKQTRVFN